MKKTSLFLSIAIIVLSAGMGLRGAEAGEAAADNSNNCSICLSSMNAQQVPEITRLSCGAQAGGHAFHTDCIAQVRRRRCPLDNANFSDGNIASIRSNYLAHHYPDMAQELLDRRQDIINSRQDITIL